MYVPHPLDSGDAPLIRVLLPARETQPQICCLGKLLAGLRMGSELQGKYQKLAQEYAKVNCTRSASVA